MGSAGFGIFMLLYNGFWVVGLVLLFFFIFLGPKIATAIERREQINKEERTQKLARPQTEPINNAEKIIRLRQELDSMRNNQ